MATIVVPREWGLYRPEGNRALWGRATYLAQSWPSCETLAQQEHALRRFFGGWRALVPAYPEADGTITRTTLFTFLTAVTSAPDLVDQVYSTIAGETDNFDPDSQLPF